MTRRLQLLIFLVGVAFLTWLIVRTGPERLLRDLVRTGWSFVPVVLVWGGVYLSNTVAWLTVLGGTKESAAEHEGHSTPGATIPFGRAFAITVSAFSLNYITPFVSLGGEPFRGAAAARWVGAQRAAASVVGFRILHTLGQFLFWASTIVVAWFVLPPTRTIRVILLAAAAVLLPASVAALALLRARALERMLNLFGRTRLLGPLGPRLAARLEPRRAALAGVDAQLAALGRRPGRLALALAAEVGGRFLSAAEFYFIAHAIGLPFGFAESVVTASALQVAVNVLFFVPFEAGTREGGLYAVARLLELPAGVGVYAALVTRVREVVWIAIGLGLIWAAGGRARMEAESAAAMGG